MTEVSDALEAQEPPCKVTGEHVPVVECIPSDIHPGRWITWITELPDPFSFIRGHEGRSNPTVTPDAVFCRFCGCPMPEAPKKPVLDERVRRIARN